MAAVLAAVILGFVSPQISLAQTAPADWCHNFNTNFGYGASGGSEVGHLHKALEKEDISFAPDTGNKFSKNQGTVSAVIAFQQKYSISPLSGFVGPLTRAKLNQLYGCLVTQPSITVTSPNGGERWERGKPYNITWDAKNVTEDVIVSIRNNGISTGSRVTFVTTAIPATAKTVSFTVPMDFTLGDSYDVRVGVGDSAPEDRSNSYFSVVAPTPADNCKYDGADGKNIGNIYKETSDLCKAVWDNSGANRPGSKVYFNGTLIFTYGCETGVCGNWCYTFTKSLFSGSRGDEVSALQIALIREGLYAGSINGIFNSTVVASVKAFQKKYSISPLSGFVGPLTRAKLNQLYGCLVTQPSITVTSPNGGERWQQGQTYRVTWNATAVDNDVYVSIKNETTKKITSSVAPVSAKDGSYSFTIDSTDYAVGDKYTAKVSNSEVSDTSDNYFSVVATDTITYTLTTTAVNGTVTKNPDQTTYASGASVTLTATANSGYHFVNWTGDATGTTNPATVTMNANKTVTANFAADAVVGCTDTDGGKDYFVKGTVTNATGSLSDLCYAADKRIAEYFCDSNGYKVYEWYDCPNGCNNGACIGSPSVAPTGNENLIASISAAILKIAQQINDLLLAGQ